jgi:hypothetical protein
LSRAARLQHSQAIGASWKRCKGLQVILLAAAWNSCRLGGVSFYALPHFKAAAILVSTSTHGEFFNA